MITQVIFKIDKKIKEQAQKKAKSRGTTFSNVLKMASYQFVEGDFEPVLRPREEFKPSVRRQILKSIADIKAGRNLSPAFNNADDAINYLERNLKKTRKV